MIRAIFLDRDGTINPDEDGYISSPSQFEIFPFSGEAIRIFNDLGFLVFIVTNQSGIARGYFTEKDLETIHLKMVQLLAKDGAKIDEILCCPHYPHGVIKEFSCECECRKPNNLFFRQMQKKYNLKASKSFMIGDKPADIEFGLKSGLQTILVRTGYGERTLQAGEIKPDFAVDNLLMAAEAIRRLVQQEKGCVE